MTTKKTSLCDFLTAIALATAVCALLWLYPLPSQAQPPGPAISATIEADAQEIFHHETFKLTLTVSSRGVRLGKSLALLSLPEKDKLRLGSFQELPLKRKRQGNQIHEIRRFRSEVRAVSPGIIEISPVLRVNILTRKFGVWGSVWKETPHDVHVEGLTLSVSPLPKAGRPENFSGAVGQFLFDVDVNPSDLAVGDLITAVMKIRGTGYLEEISTPRASPGRDFKAYDPKPVSGESGKEKTFEQILIPQSTNAVEISAISFCFFDPRAASYKTITRGPFPLTFHEKKSSPLQPYRPPPAADESGEEPEPESAPPGFSKRLGAALRTRFGGSPEATVIKNETARFAPAHSAVASFELPQGSVVRVLETSGNWAKISFENKRGWVPRGAFARE